MPTSADADSSAPASATERRVRGAPPELATPCATGTLRQQLTCQLTRARTFFFSFISSTFSALAGFLLVLVLAIYVATEPDLYHNGLMHLFPHGTRERAGEVLSVMAATLRRWLRTQLIAMATIAVVTTTALLILGIPAAFPLGLIAGVLEFIPTFGPLLSAIPAVLMGFVISPEKALVVAIVYTGIQLAENYLLIPRLMKEGMDLPPALTIMAQALMAVIFGFIGLLVAVPVLAAVVVAVKMLYVEGVVGDDVDLGDEVDA
jgi:predicted PurR-regulated permease PerM